MGILNVTPDSFSDGGQHLSPAGAVEHALQMVAAGADIIDIGGESTRPGSDPVSAQAELDRVIPVIEALRGKISVPISIDTYKATVARAATVAGAEIVNDISAFTFDAEMARTVAETGVAVCLMHTRGAPKTMQQLPPSSDIWAEIEAGLSTAVDKALAAGIERARIVIDPGIGFGKTFDDNLTIIARLERLTIFDLPILIGVSRKAFIGKLLNREVGDRLIGSVAAAAAAVMHGAHIVRVHDVAATVEAVRVLDAVMQRV